MFVALLPAVIWLLPQPAWCAETPSVSDAAVETAIQRGAAWIEQQRNSNGHWEKRLDPNHRDWAGSSALALLALLYAGRNPREESTARSLTWLAEQTIHGTYVYGLRAHVLALVPGKTYAARLQQDLDWLLKAVGGRGTDAAGAYDYEAPPPGGELGRWDHSNSQYGVLGVWMAAEAGLSVPDWYWELVGDHWLRFQNVDGGWGYQAGHESTGSMTAAGVGTLLVVLDQRYADRQVQTAGLLAAIQRGLEWLGREYGPPNPRGDPRWHYYYLYGVERAGRASGRKYFGETDWFREEAATLLAEQDPEGCWKASSAEDTLHNTAWALMFLCHGRAPLLFNKLEYGLDWNARPRDVAGLTRYASHSFERLLNWQVVRLDGRLEDLLEAPVLYLRGESKWEFNEVGVQRLREYCLRGGLVFAVAGKGSAEFRAAFEELARRALPEYPLRPLPADHPLLNGAVQFRIDSPPPLLAVDNGVRMLMLLCAQDIADAWNRYAVRGRSADFELGANVYLYATDKTTIRSRLQSPLIAPRQTQVERTVRLARIRYDGRWDVEPFGWSRLEAYMNNEAATRLLVTSGVTLDSPELSNFDVAYITGLGAFELSAAELRGLRQYLNAGGTLLADAAGGQTEFIRAVETEVRKALRTDPQALPPDSYLLTGRGIPGAIDLAGVGYRRTARGTAAGQEYPHLLGFFSGRRWVVIYSPVDLSVALLGTPVYGVRGYEPDSALRIMRNLLLYARLPTAEKVRLERGEVSPGE